MSDLNENLEQKQCISKCEFVDFELDANFLLSYGYLTISERHSSSQYSGSIPNYEMREAYRNVITEEIQGLTLTYVDSESHHQLKHLMLLQRQKYQARIFSNPPRYYDL